MDLGKLAKRVCDTLNEINSAGSIPEHYLVRFRECLPVLCRDPEPRQKRKRGVHRRTAEESKAAFFSKKQREVYRAILSQKPGILLGFIAQATSSRCSTLVVASFLREINIYDVQCFLNDSIKSQLETIAEATGVFSSSHFTELLTILQPKPTTVAEDSRFGNRIYENPTWERFRSVFGDKTCDLMVDQDGERPLFAPVKIICPSQNYEDIVVELCIARVDSLIEIMSSSNASKKQGTKRRYARASVQGLPLFLPDFIRKAIHAANLREWEITRKQEVETECVSLTVDELGIGGILRIRVAFIAFVSTINVLYAQ